MLFSSSSLDLCFTINDRETFFITSMAFLFFCIQIRIARNGHTSFLSFCIKGRIQHAKWKSNYAECSTSFSIFSGSCLTSNQFRCYQFIQTIAMLSQKTRHSIYYNIVSNAGSRLATANIQSLCKSNQMKYARTRADKLMIGNVSIATGTGLDMVSEFKLMGGRRIAGFRLTDRWSCHSSSLYIDKIIII